MPLLKSVFWMASSRDDLRKFPADARALIGEALYQAQQGGEHHRAKALQGFGGRGILEIADEFDGDAYRAAYTVKFAEAVYVPHVFQKKSKRGRASPRHEVELIRRRLAAAARHYENRRTEP